MARIDIELFELAVDLCADLMTEGVPAPVAMMAQRKIQAFAEAHAAKRKRGQNERQERCRSQTETGGPVTARHSDTPLVPPHTPPYNPSNQKQTNACGARLPDNWEPSPEDIEAAKSDGLPEELIPTVLKDFRDHFIAEPGANGYSRDWSANWRKYCRVRVDIIANRRFHRMPNRTGERRANSVATSSPAPSSFFAPVGSAQWEAHLKASGKATFPTTLHNGVEGWWFRTEWPAGEAAA
jgi:hypothetical protein